MLVDCLTLWLSNLMLADRGSTANSAGSTRRCARPPAGGAGRQRGRARHGAGNPLGRRFRDAAGRLNQEIAALADRVVFVAAGLPPP